MNEIESTAEKASVKGTSAGRPKRQARAENLRKKIFEAAAEVVGQYGYAEASVGRITEAAGIAQGTFYLYFSSRQTLFDLLLPYVGADMIEFIGKKVKGSTSFYEVEERGFRAFYEYLYTHPGFFRVLNEAEVAAPIAHQEHMRLLTERYVHSLKRSIERGEIRNFNDGELETLAYLFQAARSYLYLCHIKGKGKKKLPEWVVETYMKLIKNGLK